MMIFLFFVCSSSSSSDHLRLFILTFHINTDFAACSCLFSFFFFPALLMSVGGGGGGGDEWLIRVTGLWMI